MYSSTSEATKTIEEDLLLGKRIPSELRSDKEKKFAIAHSEVGSPVLSDRILDDRLREDPLVQIKKREEERSRKFNPKKTVAPRPPQHSPL